MSVDNKMIPIPSAQHAKATIASLRGMICEKSRLAVPSGKKLTAEHLVMPKSAGYDTRDKTFREGLQWYATVAPVNGEPYISDEMFKNACNALGNGNVTVTKKDIHLLTFKPPNDDPNGEEEGDEGVDGVSQYMPDAAARGIVNVTNDTAIETNDDETAARPKSKKKKAERETVKAERDTVKAARPKSKKKTNDDQAAAASDDENGNEAERETVKAARPKSKKKTTT